MNIAGSHMDMQDLGFILAAFPEIEQKNIS